jgi:hypothetical protein
LGERVWERGQGFPQARTPALPTPGLLSQRIFAPVSILAIREFFDFSKMRFDQRKPKSYYRQSWRLYQHTKRRVAECGDFSRYLLFYRPTFQEIIRLAKQARQLPERNRAISDSDKTPTSFWGKS